MATAFFTNLVTRNKSLGASVVGVRKSCEDCPLWGVYVALMQDLTEALAEKNRTSSVSTKYQVLPIRIQIKIYIVIPLLMGIRLMP